MKENSQCLLPTKLYACMWVHEHVRIHKIIANICVLQKNKRKIKISKCRFRYSSRSFHCIHGLERFNNHTRSHKHTQTHTHNSNTQWSNDIFIFHYYHPKIIIISIIEMNAVCVFAFFVQTKMQTNYFIIRYRCLSLSLTSPSPRV